MGDGSERRAPRQDGAGGPPTEAPRPPRLLARGLWIAAAVTAALLAAALITGPMKIARGPAGEGGVATAEGPAIGGPFHLVDQNGRAVDQHVLDGRWSAVFFGYTSCPDVCPATLTLLGSVQERLGALADRFRVVLITVDPARDHPAELKVYLSQPGFPKGALGLTGTQAQIAQVARAYHAYFARRPEPGGGYAMDHSAFIYLMDPRGRFVRTLAEQEGPDAIATAVKSAIAAG